jgi:tRNA A-37 threonylcarbamoyl transferase component Bud32
MSSTVAVGARIAGYAVVALIGEGAMASVYLAETVTGERVALKVLAPGLARDERFRQRFLRESAVAASLEHRSVVRVLAAGEEDGLLYLVMAHVEGDDLRELLRRERRLEPGRAVGLIGQVAAALDAAHAVGLVHRDVKPGNILATADANGERAFVCDFGLARYVSAASSLTGERGFVGTIDYAPPEQIQGGRVDGRADVYSLGCVLFECLTGERPFARESELAVVFAHLNEPPPRLSEIRPELPLALDAVFARALAKSPGDRFATCGELVDAARAALAGKTAPRRRRPRRRIVAAAAAVVALGAAAGVVVVTDTGPSRVEATITPTSIAEAKLGLPPAAYKQLFGTPWREAVLKGPNYPVLIFLNRKISVYFDHPGGKAIVITTWDERYKTAAGIGPCSTVDRLKAAYRGELKPSHWNVQDGKTYAYVVGKRLLFAAADLKHVTAIALYYGDAPGADRPGGAWPFAGFIATSETPCS